MGSTDVILRLIHELYARREKGLETYGKPVCAADPEPWLKHAEEEALDMAVYLRAARERWQQMEAACKKWQEEAAAATARAAAYLDEVERLIGERDEWMAKATAFTRD